MEIATNRCKNYSNFGEFDHFSEGITGPFMSLFSMSAYNQIEMLFTETGMSLLARFSSLTEMEVVILTTSRALNVEKKKHPPKKQKTKQNKTKNSYCITWRKNNTNPWQPKFLWLVTPSAYIPKWNSPHLATAPNTWWRHQMETLSALLAICAGNSPVTGEFPAQRPVTRSFDVFFDLRLNKRLSKQSWSWCFETPSRSLWRHRNEISPLAHSSQAV